MKLAPLFAKTPHLPHSFRNRIVRVAPWIALISGVFRFVTLILLTHTSISLFSVLVRDIMSLALILHIVVNFIVSILKILACTLLSKRKKKGWTMIFTAIILTTLLTLFEIAFVGTPLTAIIDSLLILWLLFEVREFYT